MTELAATLRAAPEAYARLGEIVAMTGIADGASQQDGIGEWNAAADPDALAEVLAGPVPVTVVPHEVAPLGPPAGMRAPVVGSLGVFTCDAHAAVLGPRDRGLLHRACGRRRPRPAPGASSSPATPGACTGPATGRTRW